MDLGAGAEKRKKVFAAMSGGVDSSVSAALLSRAGYDVTGVFIEVWHPDFLPCSWIEEKNDAMRVCARLQIPFLSFDFREEYKREIIDRMIEEYRRGATPNPDALCNKYIKFGAFLKKAEDMGADYVATGHYARKCAEGRICAAKDSKKDQTYFLWTLNKNILKKTLFPIGGYEKCEVRAIAKKLGISVADKKDSQGLCFLGKLDMKDFLKHYIKEKPGIVFDEDGNEVGKHDGVFFYTIGQRHGFKITKKTPRTPAYYIVKKDADKNALTVSNRAAASYSPRGMPRGVLRIKEANWVSGKPNFSDKFLAKIRHGGELFSCKVAADESGKSASVEFVGDGAPYCPANGQSLVVYGNRRENNTLEMLGGGTIFSE